VARYTRTTKKRARELRHDAFRDRTMSAFDRVGGRFEGRGRTLLYVIAGLLALAVLGIAFNAWRNKHADEARRALGRAIEINEAQVTATPQPGARGPIFATDKERAQRAVEEFQKVEAKYGDPYKTLAHYFRAANLLTVDRASGLKELEALTRSDSSEVAARAKLALADARLDDGQLDAAAALYGELAQANTDAVPADTANLRLATVYEKQGKRQEAADILFRIVETARNAKDKDGKPAPQSAAAAAAADRLERLDPARYAKLPPEPPRDLPF
jgi:lipopolysaccharide biosynthesis regulator YciM